MGNNEKNALAERTVEDCGTRAAIEAGYRVGELEGADVIAIEKVPHLVHKAGMKVESMEHLLDAPVRVQVDRVFSSPESFCKYAEEFLSDRTHLFGHAVDGRIVAVLDDHFADAGKLVHTGWGSHRAILQLCRTDDWNDLEKAHKQSMSHVEFVEFLQDHLSCIQEPDASTIIDSASAFSAHRGAKFEQVVSASGGDLEVAYTEEVRGATRSGSLPMPRRLVLSVKPFQYGNQCAVEALVRWRLPSDGKITFSLTVLRMRERLEAEFERIRIEVVQALGKAVLV